jgi:hypothetical protein
MYNVIKTEELKAIAEVNAMNTHAENALKQLQSFTRQAYDAFWFGETSPSIKVTLLGTEALKVFTDSAEVQSFLVRKIDGYVPLGVPAGFSVSFAEGGSAEIVITDEVLSFPEVVVQEPEVLFEEQPIIEDLL